MGIERYGKRTVSEKTEWEKNINLQFFHYFLVIFFYIGQMFTVLQYTVESHLYQKIRMDSAYIIL